VQAFTRYARVAEVSDDRARAELLLLANLEIGMHEQTRLQPEIRESLDAPYTVSQDLDRRLSLALMPWWRRPVARVVAQPVAAVASRAQVALADMLREVVTQRRPMRLGSGCDRVLGVVAAGLHVLPQAGRDLRSGQRLQVGVQRCGRVEHAAVAGQVDLDDLDEHAGAAVDVVVADGYLTVLGA
jgi:hypothetical protein